MAKNLMQNSECAEFVKDNLGAGESRQMFVSSQVVPVIAVNQGMSIVETWKSDSGSFTGNGTLALTPKVPAGERWIVHAGYARILTGDATITDVVVYGHGNSNGVYLKSQTGATTILFTQELPIVVDEGFSWAVVIADHAENGTVALYLLIEKVKI